MVFRLRGEDEKALAEYARALELNPNDTGLTWDVVSSTCRRESSTKH
jgi:hypothetical protein